MNQNFQTEKTMEIQPVRPTEVCDKVLCEKDSVRTLLLLSNVIDVDMGQSYFSSNKIQTCNSFF